jgi:tight adherence protein B
MPSTGALTAAATYAVWLDDRQVEVKMWVENHNLPVPADPRDRLGQIVFYKSDYTVYKDSPTVYMFVPTGPQESSGTVHLLSALRWLVSHRYLNRTDSINEVDFGWEIVSTGGTAQDFAVKNYGVTSHRRQPPKTPPPAVSTGFGPWWTYVGGVAAVFVGLFILAIALFGKLSRVGRDRTLSGMFSKYGPRRQSASVQKEPEPETTGRMATAAVSAVSRLMTSSTQDRLGRRLDLAGVTRKPAEWALFGVLVGVAITAALSLITSYVLLGVLAGSVIGWLSMRLSLSVKILRRRSAFSDQLPDILQLIASTLQAGFSLPQALDAVVREQSQPAAGEFSRALAEARIGARLEDGLEAVATRMDSDDLHWTVMAMRIQQGVGGNLAEVLFTISTTIRERSAMRRQVRALSAEGRLSAYILVALPLLVATWLFISSATYMRPLYTTTFGEVMLFLAAALIVIGSLWMHRVIKVEV